MEIALQNLSHPYKAWTTYTFFVMSVRVQFQWGESQGKHFTVGSAIVDTNTLCNGLHFELTPHASNDTFETQHNTTQHTRAHFNSIP